MSVIYLQYQDLMFTFSLFLPDEEPNLLLGKYCLEFSNNLQCF